MEAVAGTTMTTMVDAQAILTTRNIIDVGVQADEVRRRLHGARTTFVRVLEIHVDAIPSSIPSGAFIGELRIVGRPSSPEAAVAAVAAAITLAENHGAGRQAPRPPTTAFSLADLLDLAGDLQGLTSLCRRFADLGLEGIAELPIDRLEDPASAVRAARDGGQPTRRMTVHAVARPDAGGTDPRIALVERARDLQAAVGGVAVFAPLPRATSSTAPTTGYDDVKLVGLARLVVTNIDSIQVDWPLYGPKLAQVALTMGADDVDGIAAIDSGALGSRRSPLEEIRTNIRAAALDPVERDGRFAAVAGVQ
jgi:hypothetical protein